MHWQVQEAKQRLSELLRRAELDGAQFVTRHGEEVAVVLDITHYRRLAGIEVELDFKHVLEGDKEGEVADDALADVLEEVVAGRKDDLPREVDLRE
ncbi:prevent-host-death family protein [Amycolatopsis cihanbeyliensis]|uniref:Antitoxin n=2 Tax=Amycolatopsis cihanbeyliensis TaxID=1128664 RepID=A0A542DLY9_AMYCI|nr:prevent-host-death family protein [Amycolatopsis cihanbeyliensis]